MIGMVSALLGGPASEALGQELRIVAAEWLDEQETATPPCLTAGAEFICPPNSDTTAPPFTVHSQSIVTYPDPYGPVSVFDTCTTFVEDPAPAVVRWTADLSQGPTAGSFQSESRVLFIPFGGLPADSDGTLRLTYQALPDPDGNGGGAMDISVNAMLSISTSLSPTAVVRMALLRDGQPPQQVMLSGSNFANETAPFSADFSINTGDTFQLLLSTRTFGFAQFSSAAALISNGTVVATPSGATCQVNSFSVNGPDCLTVSDVAVSAQFAAHASFADPCVCCEYRQEVAGVYRANGRIIDRRGLPPFLYAEDCYPEPVPGQNLCYGHRDDPFNEPGDQYSNPSIRSAGCDYTAVDQPNAGSAAPQCPSMTLFFRGTIIDACDGGTVVETRHWQVQCGPAPSCSDGVAGDDAAPIEQGFESLLLNGRDVLLAGRVYDDGVLAVVLNIDNGTGEIPIDASEVEVALDGATPTSVPPAGSLFETELRGVTAHAIYEFDAAALGGMGALDLAVTVQGDQADVAVMLAPVCAADIVEDGRVGPDDLAALLDAWGQGFSRADLNQDGDVNATDLSILLDHWGVCS